MPQFDFAHVFLPQVVWLIALFAVLYFGVVQLTLPRLGRLVDLREGRINGDLAAARLARDTAAQSQAQYVANLAAARDSARHEITEAKAHAARALADALQIADAATQSHIHAAEGRIANAVALAEASLREVVADNAQAIVARVTGREPGLDAVLAHLDAANHL